jgi:hypothetical protein
MVEYEGRGQSTSLVGAWLRQIAKGHAAMVTAPRHCNAEGRKLEASRDGDTC